VRKVQIDAGGDAKGMHHGHGVKGMDGNHDRVEWHADGLVATAEGIGRCTQRPDGWSGMTRNFFENSIKN
jgi:hypothetical protein